MEDRINVHPGAYPRTVTNRYRITIQKGAVHVDLHVVTQMDILTVINEKGRGNPDVAATRSEQTVQDSRQPVPICRIRRIVLPLQAFGGMPTCEQRFVLAIVRFASEHFLLFGFHGT